MNDPKNPQTPAPGHFPTVEKAIASLLRLAGPRPAVPAERHDRVRAAVRAQWELSVRRRRRLRVTAWVAGSLAAAAAVLVAIGPGLRRGPPSFPGSAPVLAQTMLVRGTVHSQLLGLVTPGATLQIGDEIQTSPDGRVAVQLPDGTALRLDTGTRVLLKDKSILVIHEGAVYVDTEDAEGPAAPIEIRTPLGTVIDIGTQFEVRLEGSSVRLRVREGLVDLKRGSRSYRARAGQQLVAGVDGEVVADAAPRHGEDWRWTLEIAPSFELEGRSLAAFLDWVAREAGWRVRFEDASIAEGAPSLILHGSIEGLRPDESPAAVLPTCGLRHRIEEGTLTIGRLSGAK